MRCTAIFLLVIFISICVFDLNAQSQALLIKPKPQPIILRLDDKGKHAVNIDSFATITAVTDSVLKYKYKPASFDCSTTGKHTINVIATTSGAHQQPLPTALGFKGSAALTFDSVGNLYVADGGYQYIRRVSSDGHFSIIAGDGLPNFNDGNGRNASIGIIGSGGMQSDVAGNVYFTDSQNARIRKMDKNGVVTTITGRGPTFIEDGDPSKAGFQYPVLMARDNAENIYVAELLYPIIRKISKDGNVTTLKNSSGFAITFDGTIRGLSTDDAGNLYVCSDRLMTPSSTIVTKITPAGDRSVFFDPHNYGSPNTDYSTDYNAQPFCTLFLPNGDFYYGGPGVVKKVTKDGTITNIAGIQGTTGHADGTGGNARFALVVSMTLDPCGNLIVYDGYVRKISPLGVVTTIIGGGSYLAEEGNLGQSSCAIASADIPVKVQSVPKFLNAFADVTLNDCANLANYTVKANVMDNCPDNKVTVTQTPAPNSAIFNNVPVKVTLTATDTTGGTATVSFTATAKYLGAPPGRSVSVSASKTAICVGEAVTFTAELINGDANPSYQWLVNGFSAGANQPTFTSNNLADGDEINCAVTTGNGCGIPNTGLPVTINVEAPPEISLIAHESIVRGGYTTLKPLIKGNVVNYLWSPTTGLSDPTSPSPIATPDATTIYTLTVTTGNGCSSQASETVDVISTIAAPNSFTPNGDGINDFWNIDHLSDYTNASVKVYNRTGVLVFESKGYAVPWNGTRNNINLPVGAYYYIIDLKDGSKPQSGEVTIIR